MNIVFDLGGVVVRWEPDAIVASVFDDPDERRLARAEIIGHPDWLELDRGTLEYDVAVKRAAARTGLTEDAVDELLSRVPASLVVIPETVELMRRLKARGHSLFCLSNMQHASIEYIERTYTFWDLLSGGVISCRTRLCKPEREIYEHLLVEHGLHAADTIFIDDVEANVFAARQLGIGGIRFENAQQCERELRELGCL
jgi:putative hydrolase of the HAD superfamily